LRQTEVANKKDTRR